MKSGPGFPSIAIRMSPELSAKLDELAAKVGVNRSTAVRLCIAHMTAADLPPAFLEHAQVLRSLRVS